MVHLAEWCLLTPTIWGSDPVIGNFKHNGDICLYAVVHLAEWCLLTPTIWGSDPVIGNFKHNGDTCFDIFGILDTFGAICWSLLEPNGRATKLVQKIPKDGTKCVKQKL